MVCTESKWSAKDHFLFFFFSALLNRALEPNKPNMILGVQVGGLIRLQPSYEPRERAKLNEARY